MTPGIAMHAGLLVLSGAALVQAAPSTQPGQPGYRLLRGGTLRTVLPPDGKQTPARVAPFSLRVNPVTNAEFARFTTRNPQWRPGNAPAVFADVNYLRHWHAPTREQALQPVTHVSWFAAQAYCESEGARLPNWHEWELAAAADETRADARDDAAWRSRILGWYSQVSATLPAAGASRPNLYGIRDLHGVIWEWVQDYGALMVSGDSRNQGDPDTLKFCGAGALSAPDRENYPILMRVAMLSSLAAANTTRNLGFRCARDSKGHQP